MGGKTSQSQPWWWKWKCYLVIMVMAVLLQIHNSYDPVFLSLFLAILDALHVNSTTPQQAVLSYTPCYGVMALKVFVVCLDIDCHNQNHPQLRHTSLDFRCACNIHPAYFLVYRITFTIWSMIMSTVIQTNSGKYCWERRLSIKPVLCSCNYLHIVDTANANLFEV